MDIISDKENEKVFANGNGKFNYIWIASNIGSFVRTYERTWNAEIPPVWRVTSMMGFTANEQTPSVITTMQIIYDTEGRKSSVRIQSFGGERIKNYDYDYNKLIFSEKLNTQDVIGKNAFIEGEAIVTDRIIFENKVYLLNEKNNLFLDVEGNECQNKMLSHPDLLSKFYARIDEIEGSINNKNDENNIN